MKHHNDTDRGTVTENLSFELRGFVFSNYRNLNNGNLLLESGEILKQKWHKKTKNGMLKLTYIKALSKYLSSIPSTACHFRAFKRNAPKLKFDDLFWISDYII